MRASMASLALCAALGCSAGTIVEPEPVPADYTEWYSVQSTGEIPGHGNTRRLIYVNDVGTEYEGTGTYGNGTVIVKEVRERIQDELMGDLQYIAVMRKLVAPPDGGELQGNWLFTYLADGIESEEENRLGCWDDCHAAAPIDGAFLNYGQ
jgi:hypothetical protein